MRSLTLLFLGMLLATSVEAQMLTTAPQFIRETSSGVEITVDATKGNLSLKDYGAVNDVYVHIGVITSLSTSSTDWKYSRFTWATTNSQASCVSLGNNKWKYTITGDLRSFFGITNTGEKILRIALLFRNGNGTLVQRNIDGSDMYIPVYDAGLQVRITEPFRQPTFTQLPEPVTRNVGDQVSISSAASSSATLSISYNGTAIASQNGVSSLQAQQTISVGGTQTIIATATDGTNTVRDTLSFFVATSTPVLPLPAGVKDGINYESGDTSATLVLFAPAKSNVYVLGDFNNWTQSSAYQMNKTPDGNRYWLRITGLVPGREYAYQYLVDGTLRIADYNTEKVLDPNNDRFIPASSYPNLMAYPTGKATGIVSVLQTAKPAYTWQVNNFVRPDKRNLVIYELLLRDFLAQPNWNTLRDTLSYIKRLGANVIHLMPFSEF